MDATADFADLMRGVRAGEPWARNELVRRFGDDVRRAARYALGSAIRRELDSEDVTQTIFLRAFSSDWLDRPIASTPGGLVALLTVTARRWARSVGRKRSRQRELLVRSIATGVRAVETVATETRTDPAEAAALLAELRSHVPEALYKVLLLRREGMSIAAAARELGLNPDVTRVNLSRMRRDIPARFARIAEDL